MPDFKYARGRIEETIQFIAGEIKEFDEEYSLWTWKDYQQDKKIQKLMDRTVENILTALIEICGAFLTQKSIAVENYAQVLTKCAQELGFSEEEQGRLAGLAGQRNRLAHRYLNFRWLAVSGFMESRPLISELLKKIMDNKERID